MDRVELENECALLASTSAIKDRNLIQKTHVAARQETYFYLGHTLILQFS